MTISAQGRKMDNDTTENKRNGRGRPSKPKQVEIERTLRSLFIKGVKPYQVKIETNYSPNTIKDYYGEICKEIRDLEGPDFALQCKNRIVSACLAIDQQIEKQEKMQEELEHKLETGGKEDLKIYKLLTNLSNSISDLHMKRLGIAISPTYDDMLEAMREVEKQK